MKSKLLLLVFFCSCCTAFAQREVNIWCFGISCGVDFNSGVPVPFSGAAIHDNEACASIANSAGSLLFYTDGSTVWNRLHLPMPNGTGLFGHGSCTQGALIVPKPGSSLIYYVFTQDQTGLPLGLRYSEVDLSLNGGLGDVTATKNVLLATPVTEKLAAVKNANGTDIWVIAHDFTSDAFFTYAVTAAGVNTTPVITHAGSVDTAHSGLGYLRPSADGKKIAQAVEHTDVIDLLDFNAATGVLTTDYSLSFPRYTNPYGLEFSPDRKRLYFSGDAVPYLTQLDLTLASPALVRASATVIGTTSSAQPGALQLGPDGKIYFAKWSGSLGCISDPNALGSACHFTDNAVPLAGGACRFGLPNMIQSWFHFPPIRCTDTCFADSAHFSLIDTSPADSVRWNFDDPASGAANTSVSVAPAHRFTHPGTFAVSVITYTNAFTDTAIRRIVINSPPGADFSVNPAGVLRPGETAVFSAPPGNASFSWEFGDPQSGSDTSLLGSPSHSYSLPGDYCIRLAVRDSAGCRDTAQKCITVENPLSIPNVFTPNGDGRNDRFVIESLSPGSRLRIYDRWGTVIYESSAYANDWTGGSASDGVYYYILADPARKKEYSGFVQLISH